jgi:KDO2-lipid IV(A) lauroyltransferase
MNKKSNKVSRDERPEFSLGNPGRVRETSARMQSRSTSATVKDYFLCGIARALLGLVKILPFSWVLHFGRALGEIVFWFDFRHRRVALENLERCFGQGKSDKELRRLVRENFRRLGEAFGGAMKSSFVDPEVLKRRVEVVVPEDFSTGFARRSRIVAMGHFGNFELLAHVDQFLPGYRAATTYRGMRYPAFEKLVTSVRKRSGCLYFERQSEAKEFRAALKEPGMLFGIAADLSTRSGCLRLPFLGHDCWTTTAPAVFALRYRYPLHVAVCHRTGVGRYCLEISEEIPTRLDGAPRPISDIMLDVNRVLEKAIYRDPANWFWMYNRWRGGSRKHRGASNFAALQQLKHGFS